jgi:hypothetical protein
MAHFFLQHRNTVSNTVQTTKKSEVFSQSADLNRQFSTTVTGNVPKASKFTSINDDHHLCATSQTIQCCFETRSYHVLVLRSEQPFPFSRFVMTFPSSQHIIVPESVQHWIKESPLLSSDT